MHSFMRQPQALTDQMHSFLRDKQAWENAIAMYQGPDPLDHWYNYIIWYESHGHGDPENKYSATLTRCLGLFEHNDYYKQDPRMVRLWLKYIDLQSNPLHFYQALYQRGVGKQNAPFYISWANYYESINALKEAESVFNLAFQEKAQTYAELHYAHNKLMHARSASAQKANLLQQQQTVLHYHPHQLEQQHMPSQIHIQEQQENIQIYKPESYQHIQQQQQQIQISVQQQQQLQQYTQFQQSNYSALQAQQVHISQQQHYQQPLNEPTASAEQQIQQYHINGVVVTTTSFEPANANEAISPDAVTAITPTNTAPTSSSDVQTPQTNQQTHEEICTVPGIKLPRKFASFCSNNTETWKPALFLEEPDDPNRRCHYAKELVYPGTGVEYSPEEICARKYLQRRQEKLNEEEANTLRTQTEQQIEQSRPRVQKLEVVGQIQQSEQYHHFAQVKTYEEYGNTLEEYEQADEEDEDIQNVEDEEDDVEGTEVEGQYNRLEQHSRQQQQTVPSIANSGDDLEEQIKASTIRFSMHPKNLNQTSETPNKTIKIKFKKERHHGANALNGSSAYSAYTIERIYQPDVSSPKMYREEHINARKNGLNFHPYLLGQTSTPKTSAKRSKLKIKNVNNRYQEATHSSSNSSLDYGVVSETKKHLNVCDNAVQNASFNDNANYSFSSAVALDNSNCSLTAAVGHLNFRDAVNASNAGARGVSVNNSTCVVDVSTYQENSYFATQYDVEAKNRRLQKALETIDRHLARESIDPFNSELCKAFLTKLDFPGGENASESNYKIIQTLLPKLANAKVLSLPDGVNFNIDKEVGRGSYGSVFKATDLNTGAVLALKYQKPPNTWEIYICDQVFSRIKSDIVLPGLMDISTAIIAPNASLIATEFSPYGSLLDINNKIRQATTKVMHESLVMHFSAQICNIIRHLHQHHIIHADIKPDNFLLMKVPNTDMETPSLRLIDFGCAIDMTLFPKGEKTKFRKVIQTDGFTCIEMQEGRPWSYETDLFCIAGTVHVMLFGEYMQLQKRGGAWDIKQKLPRYLKKHVWTRFFSDMLNIKSSKLPDLYEMQEIFEAEALKMDSELQSQIRTLSNILHRR